MAIRDLLWACPLCRAIGALEADPEGDRCRHCGASFRRAGGSAIEARLRDGTTRTRPAAAWVDDLPPDPLEAGARQESGAPPAEASPGRERLDGEGEGQCGSFGPASKGGSPGEGERGRGSAEGPAGPGAPDPDGPGAGRLPSLRRDRVLVRFALRDEPIRRGGVYLGAMEVLGPERQGSLALSAATLDLRLDDGETHAWRLDDIAALQASSRSLQLRPRKEAVVTLSFPDSSARLWEETIAAALRRRWRQLGRGEIIEFQPRIIAR